MTFKEKIQGYLKETIYFDQDIEAIMASVMNDKDRFESMLNRWNDQIDGYPASVMIVILMSVDTITLEWLKDKKPKHFTIPYFEYRVHGTPIPKAKEED